MHPGDKPKSIADTVEVSFHISCPCGQVLTVGPTMVGLAVRCPRCSTLLEVPSPDATTLAVGDSAAVSAAATEPIPKLPPAINAGPWRTTIGTPRPDNFIAEELAREAARRPKEAPEKRDPIDPTPLLAIAGGTAVLMVLVGLGFYGLDQYLDEVKERAGSSGRTPRSNLSATLPAEQVGQYDHQRRESQMHEIAAAIQRHNETHNQYPQSLWSREVDANGRPKPYLSWRVKILPHIGEGFLYNRFQFDEPWDSPHNLKLAQEHIPDLYKIGSGDKSGLTTYKLVTGEGTAANEPNPLTPDEVAKWPSSPVLVVQVPPEKAVFWSKPDDWEHSQDATPSSLGFPQDDRFLALHYDGAVKWTSKQTPVEQFHQMMLMPKGQ